jgi:hypothetical protein
MSLTELELFAEEAENFRFPLIDVGGVILPGESAVGAIQPGEGQESGENQGTQTRSEARSATGSRQRSPAEAASGARARPVECRLIDRELEELKRYHPQATVIFNSSSFVIQRIPIRLFSSLPYTASLVLEIPRVPFFPSPMRPLRAQSVPDVRAWAFWGDQRAIASHHQLPDGSMCAYFPDQGRLGVTRLYEIVGMCICWVAKCLCNQVFDRWPGPQHYGQLAMRLRDRPDEFCGCGRQQRYGQCHRAEVEATPFRDLLMASLGGNMMYARELRSQNRLHYAWSRQVPGGLISINA